MILSSTCLFLALSALPPLPDQSVGGTPLHRINGRNAQEHFGEFVAIAGDLNHDGYDDILVGSPEIHHLCYSYCGRTQVFSGADGSILYQWDLVGSFGTSVANAGDTNGDGTNDILVGAPDSTANGEYLAGSAFLFSGADGSLLHRWDGQIDFAQFGKQVANAGDVDADGFPDVIIVSPWDSKPGGLQRQGAIFVYSGLTGALLREHWGKYSWRYAEHQVSGLGDIDQDGFDDYLLGLSSLDDSHGGSRRGFVRAVSGKTGFDLYRREMRMGPDHQLPVSSAGDQNSDGIPDFMIGHEGGNRQGIVDVISGADGAVIRQWEPPEDSDLISDNPCIMLATSTEMASMIASLAILVRIGVPNDKWVPFSSSLEVTELFYAASTRPS